MYAAKTRRLEEDFFATIRTASGGAAWEHVRTNLGRKVAYAMMAKHWEGEGKIEHFRDTRTATAEDRNGARDSDGVLRNNIWAGYGEMSVYF